jgi:hypothetical protein
LKTTTAVGSKSLHYNVDLEATPKPNGFSYNENNITFAYYGIFSDIFAKCAKI